MVTSAFLFEDTFPDDIPFNKMIAISATLFLFFFGNYLMNFMSAELVVFTKPPVIIGYEGVLERLASGAEVAVIFLPGIPETLLYQEAPEGSIEKQMWDIRMPVTNMDNVMTLIGELQGPIMNQTAVAIFREIVVTSITGTAFRMVGEVADYLRAVISILPTEGRFFNAMAIRRTMDPVIKENLKRS